MGNKCYQFSHFDDLKSGFDWENETSVRKKTAWNSVRNASLGKEMWLNKTLFLRSHGSGKNLRKSSSPSSLKLRKIGSITFADEVQQIILLEPEDNKDDAAVCRSDHCDDLASFSASALGSSPSCHIVASCAPQMTRSIMEPRSEGNHASYECGSVSTITVSTSQPTQSKLQQSTHLSPRGKCASIPWHEPPLSSIQLKRLPAPSPQHGCTSG